MYTTSKIKRHISCLPAGALFTTRDCLCFGLRAAVDQALARLVKAQCIERLARGIFLKPSSQRRVVSALEIASVKAAAFRKRIVEHAADVAQRLGLIRSGNQEPTFATSGRSSSFRFRSTVIHFKGTGPRKIDLGDSRAGSTIRALWHLGQAACTPAVVSKVTLLFNRIDRQEVRQSGALMPAWLPACFSFFAR
jgi:hypothetical protein